MANKIQLRRDTAANWTRINPVLADGEPGLDIDNNKIKLGDGTTAWSQLPYLASPEHNRLVSGAKILSVGTDGKISLPGSVSANKGKIGNNNGVIVESSTNTWWQFDTTGTMTFPDGTTTTGDTVIAPSTYDIQSVGSTLIQTSANAGAKTWEFGADGHLTVPMNGVITALPGFTGTTFNIINITQGNPVVIITSVDHGLTSGSKIFVHDITTTTELNNQEFYVTTPAPNMVALYADPDCTVRIDGTSNTPYNAASSRVILESVSSAVYDTDASPAGFSHSLVINNNYLTSVASSGFSIGANDDFTVETYVKFSYDDLNVYGYSCLLGSEDYGSGINILIGQGNGIFKGNGAGGGAWIGGNMPGSWYGITNDVWYHMAVVRSSGSIRWYLDGVQRNAHPGNVDGDTTAFPNVSNINIGRAMGYNAHGTKFSNYRFVVGTAVYTGNFTPPTSALTSIPGTQLLMYLDGDTFDYSNSLLSPGGGQLTQEIKGADLTLQLTSPNPGVVDTGDIKIVNNTATWAFNESGTVTLPNSGAIASKPGAVTQGALFTLQASNLVGATASWGSPVINSDNIVTTGWDYVAINDSAKHDALFTLLNGSNGTIQVGWGANSTASSTYVLIQFNDATTFQFTPVTDAGASAPYAGTWYMPASFGSVNLTGPTQVDITSGKTSWAFDSDGTVTQYQLGAEKVSSGQKLVKFTQTDITNGITLSSVSSVIYVVNDALYQGSDALNIDLPGDVPVGTRITIINNYNGTVNVTGWPGPPYAMMGYESIDLVCVSDPGFGGNYWWVTNSFTW